MTNQAAQTMPELPDSQYRGGNDVFGKEFPLYTADQMHQYARDYALSQTAGVAEGFVLVDADILSEVVDDACNFLATDRAWDFYGVNRDGLEERYRGILNPPTAPAASGGEDDHG